MRCVKWGEMGHPFRPHSALTPHHSHSVDPIHTIHLEIVDETGGLFGVEVHGALPPLVLSWRFMFLRLHLTRSALPSGDFGAQYRAYALPC